MQLEFKMMEKPYESELFGFRRAAEV